MNIMIATWLSGYSGEVVFLGILCTVILMGKNKIHKDKRGNILSEHQDILQRWKQYFCDLQSLNDPNQKWILKI